MDHRYRTLPEPMMVEAMVLLAWPFELESGRAWKLALVRLQEWTQAGLPFSVDADGERLFDPVEVFRFSKRLGGASGREFADRMSAVNRRLVQDLAESGGLSLGKEKKFEVEFTRTFHLESVAPGRRLRLRMPLPLTSDFLTELRVDPFVRGTKADAVLVTPGRLELRMIAAGEREVTLGAKIHFHAQRQESQSRPPQPLEDAPLYLKEREGLVVVTHRIRALAISLRSGKSPTRSIRAFWDFIHEELKNGPVYYDQLDPAAPGDSVLDTGWYDCQMGAALLVALCRAAGIPARMVGGFLLHGLAPTKHFWAEAWLEETGWTPFDFFGLGQSDDGDDRPWRDHFYGRLEYRMTCERLPQEFTGVVGVPLPAAWYLLQTPCKGGTTMALLGIDGRPIYTDVMRVRSQD